MSIRYPPSQFGLPGCSNWSPRKTSRGGISIARVERPRHIFSTPKGLAESGATSPEERGPIETQPGRKAETDRVREGISEGFRLAESDRVAPGGEDATALCQAFSFSCGSLPASHAGINLPASHIPFPHLLNP
jgi:hypothetical protein